MGIFRSGSLGRGVGVVRGTREARVEGCLRSINGEGPPEEATVGTVKEVFPTHCGVVRYTCTWGVLPVGGRGRRVTVCDYAVTAREEVDRSTVLALRHSRPSVVSSGCWSWVGLEVVGVSLTLKTGFVLSPRLRSVKE